MAIKWNDEKFKVLADLGIYEALQENGKLSEEKIAERISIPATTVHYALKRLKERDFFHIAAIPKLSKFQDLPMAAIGFSEVSPLAIKKIRDEYGDMDTVMTLLHGEKEVILFLVDYDRDRLTRTLFQMMSQIDSKPSTCIIAPEVVKWEPRLPGSVLKGAYGGRLFNRQARKK